MLDKFITWYITTRFQFRQLVTMRLHTSLKKPLANFLVYAGILHKVLGNRKAGLNLILKARRVNEVCRATSIIRSIVHGSENSKSELYELLPEPSGRSIEHAEDRILILKLPIITHSDMVEKGAIIIKFTETFSLIYDLLNVPLLMKYFRIIMEPSWVGYSLPEILAWTRFDQEKVIVLAPYQDDYEFLTAIDTNLIPMTLGPADWVDPSKFFKIRNEEKYYDAIYLANYNPVKRVERYIQAVSRITRVRPGFRAALVLASHGYAKREILAILDRVKKYSKLSVFYDLDQTEINKLFNRSKVNILVSLREGANKGLAEGLFAGVPALLIKESAGGNYMHINDQTGRVVPDAELEDTLLWFCDNYKDFTPDSWAMSHISPMVSSKLLSEKLKEIELSEGRQWTSELMPKVNRPELTYLHPEHKWLLSKRQCLLQMFSNDADVKSIEQSIGQLLDAGTSS